MGDDFSATYFGVMDEGVYVPVGTVDQTGLSVASSDGVTDYYDKPMLQALEPQTFGISVNVDMERIGDALNAMETECIRLSDGIRDVAMCFDRVRYVLEYRHKFVWQYNRERKGNKANRRKRGRWQQLAIRTMIPNATVTDIRQPLSADAFAPAEVKFEGKAHE